MFTGGHSRLDHGGYCGVISRDIGRTLLWCIARGFAAGEWINLGDDEKCLGNSRDDLVDERRKPVRCPRLAARIALIVRTDEQEHNVRAVLESLRRRRNIADLGDRPTDVSFVVLRKRLPADGSGAAREAPNERDVFTVCHCFGE